MDINLVSHAKDYIDDLAKGINPFTKEEIDENDFVNNVKISRCLFFVSEILREVIENGGISSSAKVKLTEFDIESISTDSIEISDAPVTVSVIAQRINAVKPENMKKLKVTAISNWLVSIDMLRVVTINNKNMKKVTDNGRSLGLTEEERINQNGTYHAVTYNRNAQQFIVDNLNSIIAGGFNGSSKENAGKPWSEDELFLLKSMYDEGASVSDIAKELKRSNGAIKARIEKFASLND